MCRLIIYVKTVAVRLSHAGVTATFLKEAFTPAAPFAHFPSRRLQWAKFSLETSLSHDTFAQGTFQSLQEFHGHLQMQEAVRDPQRATSAPRSPTARTSFYPKNVKSRPGPFHMAGRRVTGGRGWGANLGD